MSTRGRTRLVITVGADGTVRAQTQGVTGEGCLEYVSVLEDLAGAPVASSDYTSDYTAVHDTQTTHQENRGVERA